MKGEKQGKASENNREGRSRQGEWQRAKTLLILLECVTCKKRWIKYPWFRVRFLFGSLGCFGSMMFRAHCVYCTFVPTSLPSAKLQELCKISSALPIALLT